MASRNRTLALITTAVMTITAATALAVTPKPGAHGDLLPGPVGSTVVLSMSVNDDGAIFAVLGNDPDCPTPDGLIKGFRIDKEIPVKDNGKFKFDGKTAQNTSTGNPPKIHVLLKGKFSSSKKASGTYKIEGCDDTRHWETKYFN